MKRDSETPWRHCFMEHACTHMFMRLCYAVCSTMRFELLYYYVTNNFQFNGNLFQNTVAHTFFLFPPQFISKERLYYKRNYIEKDRYRLCVIRIRKITRTCDWVWKIDMRRYQLELRKTASRKEKQVMIDIKGRGRTTVKKKIRKAVLSSLDVIANSYRWSLYHFEFKRISVEFFLVIWDKKRYKNSNAMINFHIICFIITIKVCQIWESMY